MYQKPVCDDCGAELAFVEERGTKTKWKIEANGETLVNELAFEDIDLDNSTYLECTNPECRAMYDGVFDGVVLKDDEVD